MNSLSRSGLASLSIVFLTTLLGARALAQDAPPTDPGALFDYLKAGKYKAWPHETTQHASRGPHPIEVLSWLNPILNKSMAENAKTHPKGAAAVKELFNVSGNLSGWAVSVKTDDDSAAGQGWYWYEVLSVEAGAKPVAADNSVPLCVGCHTPGRDFVLTHFPLK